MNNSPSLGKTQYQEYFEAIRKILDGHHVADLEEMRKRCNEKSPEIRNSKTYTQEAVLISFAAHAENEILGGADPSETYGIFKGSDARQKCRRVLERSVEKYLEQPN